MTAITGKKIEGFISELNPTTIVVSGKTIYLPQEKRGYVTGQNLSEGDPVRIIYTVKGDIISVDKLTEDEKNKLGKPPEISKAIDAEAEQKKKMHIDTPNTVGIPTAKTSPANNEIHIQHEESQKDSPQSPAMPINGMYIHPPKSEWITEREKNDTIILQSILLARSVEIVNANYLSLPETSNGKDFAELLNARCNFVEQVADRLFEYVKKKAQEDQKP